MNKEATRIDRSNLLIIAFQLDGLCSALRQSVVRGVPVGPGTFETIQKLHAAFSSIHSGPSLDVLPKIEATSPASDVLTFAEILRATCGAFLSPDEVTARQRAIGFHQ